MKFIKIINRWTIVLSLLVVIYACSDESVPASKGTLQAKIDEAQQIHDSAVEGTKPGDQALGSKQTLQDKIDWAHYIRDFADNETGYANATGVLQKAIEAFKVNVVKAGMPHFTNNAYFNAGPVARLLPNLSGFTIECRIRLDDLDTDGYAGLGSLITADDGSVGILLRYTGSGAVESYIFDDGWFGAVTAGGVLEPGTWYYISMSFDGHDLRVYIDGVEAAVAQSPDALVPQVETDAPFFIGMSRNFEFDPGDQRSMHGNIQEVRFWDHTRTPAEIAATYNTQIDATEAGLTAYWPFDINIGSTVIDKTGNFVAKGKNVTWQ